MLQDIVGDGRPSGNMLLADAVQLAALSRPNGHTHPPPDGASSPFARTVDACISAGLLKAVLPVIPPDAETEPHLMKNRGKIPGRHRGGHGWCGFGGWTKHVTTAADIDLWRTWPGAGLCLQTAELPALDVDVEAPEVAAALDRLIRDRVGRGVLVRTRGSSPRRAFLFRVSGSVWKKRVVFRLPGDDREHAVDLLGIGQQLVIAGRHPGGESYGLEAPGLAGRTLADIPCLTPDDLEALWEEIHAAITGAGGRIEGRGASAPRPRDRQLTPAQTVMAAICQRRDRWVPALLGLLPRPADREWRISGAELLRDDLQEDLVVFDDGIYDFGTERAHDPVSLIREFGAVNGEAIQFGGCPLYDARDGQPYAVVGEPDPSLRRPTEGEALTWLARCLNGSAIAPDATRAGAMPALAAAVGLDWSVLEAPHFDAEAAARQPADPPPSAGEGETPTAAGSGEDLFEMLSLGEIVSRPPLRFVIGRHLPERSVGFLYGDPGTGKSFIALDWALHLAFGRSDWHGDTIEADSEACVIYLAGEGAQGFKTRVLAWLKHRGIPESEIDGGRFKLIPASINMMSRDEVKKLVRTIQRGVGRACLVIADTVSRSMPGADENAQKEMTLFVQACDVLRDSFGYVVLGVHHANRQGAMRGSSVLLGAGDFVFKLRRERGKPVGKLVCEKQKDAPDGWEESYRFAVVEVEGGSSLVPVRCSVLETAAGPVTSDLTALAMDAMQAAWNDGDPWGETYRAGDRHAVKRLVSEFSFTNDGAEAALKEWLDEGRIELCIHDRRTKRKGYRVSTYKQSGDDIFG